MRTFTELEFESLLSFLREQGKEECFETFTCKQEWKGLTDSWTCRFDDGKLFEKTGLTTGKTLHFMELGLN